MTSRTKGYPRRGLRVSVVGVFVAGLAGWVPAAHAQAGCDPPAAPAAEAVSVDRPRIGLAVLPDTRLHVVFQGGRGVGMDEVPTVMKEGSDHAGLASPVQVAVNLFKRDDAGAAIPRGAISAWAVPQASKLLVNLCADITAAGVPPGLYRTTVVVTDPGFETAEIPAEISIQSPNLWTLGMGASVLAGVMALLVALVATGESRAAGGLSSEKLLGPLRSGRGVVTLIAAAGAGATAFGIYGVSNPAWGAAVTDYFSLPGQVFTAMLAGATGVTAVGKTVGSGSRLREITLGEPAGALPIQPDPGTTIPR